MTKSTSTIRLTLRVLAVLLLMAFHFGKVAGQPTQQALSNPDRIEKKEIAPGLIHTSIARRTSSGLWLIHFLEVDVTKNRIAVARAMDEIVGSETTSSIAQRRGAEAAINGGYFRVGGTYRGEPVGTFIVGGKVKSEPNGARPSIAVDSSGTKLALVDTRVEMWLETGAGQRLDVSGVDRPREANEIIVYTPDFHRTTLTNPDGLEVAIRANRVTRLFRGGSSIIPADGLVVSLSGDKIARLGKLRPGDRLRFRQNVTYSPKPEWEPAFVLGAGPILIRNGRLADRFEGFPESFLKTRHPRTALGLRTDGTVILLTVDGRQAGKSDGMSIYELQQLMSELNCIEAFNLDGGGSTTMVVKGKVANSVSDATGERPVSDAIIVTRRDR